MNMTPVFDGKMYFDGYYFEGGQLYKNDGRKVRIYHLDGSKIDYVDLFINGQKKSRSLPKLKRWSCPDKKLRQLLKRVQKDFVPVFGFQDTYKFNPNKPFEVFNIKKRTMMKVMKLKKYYAVAIKVGKEQNMLIHQIVMQYYLQKRIDPKKYQIHHLSHITEQNNISNLMLLPISIHSIFENYYKSYVGGEYFKIKYTKQDMIKFINEFDISQTDKKRLIDSL